MGAANYKIIKRHSAAGVHFVFFPIKCMMNNTLLGTYISLAPVYKQQTSSQDYVYKYIVTLLFFSLFPSCRLKNNYNLIQLKM